MNTLTAVVLLVAVAYTGASGILAGPLGLGLAGHGAARGALEGALGGQWIPDVPVAAVAPGIIAPGAAALGAGHLGLGLAGPLGLGLAGHGILGRGALEGALGGQWIPDTHGK